MQLVKINIRKVRLYTMEKKLVVQLREVKKDLEGIINRLEANNSEDFLLDILHVGFFLDEWKTGKMENEAIRDMAFEVSLKLDKIIRKETSQKTYQKNLIKRNKKRFIASIKKVLEIINEELPKEERLDNLEEKLSRAEVSFLNYDYHSEENIQEMIHSNARAIARLLVTSNK